MTIHKELSDFLPGGSDFKAMAGSPVEAGVALASEADLVAALKTVYDPEIPVDIFELGLIYGYDIGQDGSVEVIGNVTASGDISSSGAVIANTYQGTQHMLRCMSFYVNDDPLIQNSVYFGGTLNHQNSNWNDPQAVGGAISSTNSFTIVEDDMNWGIILPFDISKIEIQLSLRAGGACGGDDFTAALYTANRSSGSNTAITLTKATHSQTTLTQGNFKTNDFTHTADLDKGTMIFVGVGSEDSTAAKNARGIMNIIVTQR